MKFVMVRIDDIIVPYGLTQQKIIIVSTFDFLII